MAISPEQIAPEWVDSGATLTAGLDLLGLRGSTISCPTAGLIPTLPNRDSSVVRVFGVGRPRLAWDCC